jgi:serine/threonine-protein kinase
MKVLKNGQLVAGRYLVERYLDEGGMQQVYIADDLNLDRKVALKTPKNSSGQKRFNRSATVSALISHANVARTYDYFEEDGKQFLVEELIVGSDLKEVFNLNFTHLDPFIVSHIGHLLFKGLSASHKMDVQHRDLKLSNIMICGGESFEKVKITDFGVAKLAQSELALFDNDNENVEESINASHTLVGAMPYIAPEVILKDQQEGLKSDVWSMGAILYHLLAGTPPYGSAFASIIIKYNNRETLKEIPHINDTSKYFRTISNELYSIVQRCLAFDVNQRPSADEVLEMFSKLCYQSQPRKFGVVNNIIGNNVFGFITPDDRGKSVFFPLELVYGTMPSIGDRVCYSEFEGSPQNRAFPVFKCK